MSKLYALLVGIDDYAPDVGALTGCVNDAQSFHDYLTGEFGSAAASVELLSNGDATRSGIIELFRRHLGQAGPEDTALFLYCGHGARWASAKEFQRQTPDAMDEGLVCIDSRNEGGFDLADKELAVLLEEVARRDPHVAVIFDSCHSGSGTRGVQDVEFRRARQTHTVHEERPFESYLEGHYARAAREDGPLRIPNSRHVLMAAAERWQRAYEGTDNLGRSHGLFSMTLLEELSRGGGVPSYSELFRRCRSRVHGAEERQTPQFESFGGFDASQGFLGRVAETRPERHAVFLDGTDWKVRWGAMQGVPTDAEREVTFKIYSGEDSETPTGAARVARVGAQDSRLELDFEPEADASLKAVVSSLPAPGLPFLAQGEASEIAGPAGLVDSDQTSGFDLTDSRAAARYALRVGKGGLEFRDLARDVAIQRVVGTDEGALSALLEPMRQVAAWERGVALQNQRTAMNPALLEFWLTWGHGLTTRGSASDPMVPDRVTVDVPAGERVDFTLHALNRTSQRLHLALFYFSPAYGVVGLHNAPVSPEDREVDFWVDFMQLGDGVDEESFFLKLVVSTEPVDSFLVEMQDLEIGREPSRSRGLGSQARAKYRDEWFTRTLEVKLLRQGAGVGQREVTLADGDITIRSHSSVTANSSVSSADVGGRGVGDAAIARLLGAAMPYERLTCGRSRAAGPVGVLELTDIENAEALAEEPLEIVLDAELSEDEAILPLCFDGEHVLLGGAPSRLDDGRTLIRIDRLHDLPSDRRSVAKALKLQFLKTALGRRGVNELRWVEYAADGSAERHLEGVAEKVAAANNVMLVIHGILGDTGRQVEGVGKTLRDGMSDASGFDLVLTYDYENLTTSIAETAREMGERLAAAGLTAEDGKQLTIVAHSMGGLVSRSFIEQHGGDAVVDHLVMCGTPNGGTPFGDLAAARELANVLTTLMLNYAPLSAPFCLPFWLALSAARQLSPTLAQMAADSEFLDDLNRFPDNNRTRYSILAANAADFEGASDDWLPQLLAKTVKSTALEEIFGTNEHDVAGSVASILSAGQRPQAAAEQEVACIHTNYFTSKAGLEALARVEW